MSRPKQTPGSSTPPTPNMRVAKGADVLHVLRQMIFWVSHTPAKSVLCCNDRSFTAYLLRSGRGRETFTGLHVELR